MKTTEIRFSGFGGQGIIRCALISGKALSLFDGKNASMNQSFGPEARGSACSSQLVVSGERVLYPYITKPEILVSMSQEAYEKYEPELRDDGMLIIDTDLVKPKPLRGKIQMFAIPSTRFAEELGNRIIANLVMLGFFTAVTKVVTPDAMKQALPGLVPDRFLDLNIRAFDKGYEYGLRILEESKQKPKKAKTKTRAKAAPKAKGKTQTKTKPKSTAKTKPESKTKAKKK
ncbi:MAG: 2-oxoacid:acceptor oxidoreductase family protein [Candidatus Aminicenantes bacterium]|jgi:2-oxoglutarate ferredoxin oxidoreductase subunit gamma